MKKKPDFWYLFGVFFTLSLEVVAFVIGGFLLGHSLDRYFATSPWGAFTLTTLGFVLAIVRVIWRGKRLG